MTVATMTEKKEGYKDILLNVGEAKTLIYHLSYMARSVKIGFKKQSKTRKEFREKYNKYKSVLEDLIDQIKDYSDSNGNENVIFTVKESNFKVIKEFIDHQINLFTKMQVDGHKELSTKINEQLTPLYVLSSKLR